MITRAIDYAVLVCYSIVFHITVFILRKMRPAAQGSITPASLTPRDSRQC
jgi:hypothetical protein